MSVWMLLLSLLAAPLPASAREGSDPRWFVSMLGGAEHGARYARHFIEQHPAEAFPVLLACTRERPAHAGRCARWLVLAIRTPADRERALDAFAALFDAPPESRELRRSTDVQVIGAAGEIGPEARSLVPRIATRLRSYRTSGSAVDLLPIAESLARIEPGNPEIVPAIEAVLFDRNARWQHERAVAVLGGRFVRATAVTALGSIGDPASIPALIVASRNPAEPSRRIPACSLTPPTGRQPPLRRRRRAIRRKAPSPSRVEAAPFGSGLAADAPTPSRGSSRSSPSLPASAAEGDASTRR